MDIAEEQDDGLSGRIRTILTTVGIDPKGVKVIEGANDVLTLIYPDWFEAIGYDKDVLQTDKEILDAIIDIVGKVSVQTKEELEMLMRHRKAFG